MDLLKSILTKKLTILLLISIFAAQKSVAQIDSVRFPVSLSSFEAGLLNNTTKLRWKTACYISYANFQIQKSSNGTTFYTINNFTADRLRCQQPFEFIDSLVNTGILFTGLMRVTLMDTFITPK